MNCKYWLQPNLLKSLQCVSNSSWVTTRILNHWLVLIVDIKPKAPAFDALKGENIQRYWNLPMEVSRPEPQPGELAFSLSHWWESQNILPSEFSCFLLLATYFPFLSYFSMLRTPEGHSLITLFNKYLFIY
jgi:hypothetical protein